MQWSLAKCHDLETLHAIARPNHLEFWGRKLVISYYYNPYARWEIRVVVVVETRNKLLGSDF